MEYGNPLWERKNLIKELLESSKDSHNLDFKGKILKLPVITVPIGSLKYRIENDRTGTDQEQYAVKLGIEKDWFRGNGEEEDVQKIQHDFLYIRALDPVSNLEKTFVTNKATQTEPLVINNRSDGKGIGFVVNGNRRLALWRKLFQENPEIYDFASIVCAVLPQHFTPEQEEDLEFDLQVKPLNRAEYDWIDKRKAYRRQLDRFEDQDEGWATVAQRAGNMQQSDLKRDMVAYEYAEEYLEKLGKESHWDLIKRDEMAFTSMANVCSSKKLSPTDEAELKHLCRELIYKKPPTGEIYKTIQGLAKYKNQVIKDIQEEDLPPIKKQKTKSKRGKAGALKPKSRKQDLAPSVILDRPIGELSDFIVASISEQRIKDRREQEQEKTHITLKRTKSTINSLISKTKKSEFNDRELEEIKLIKEVLSKMEKKIKGF